MIVKVGEINLRLIQMLGLSCSPGTPILMGDGNVAHMKKRHPHEFNAYHNKIPLILSNPDYVRKSSDGSIEFVKEFKVNTEFVKVAVRMSGSSTWYLRTMYTLNPNRVNNYIQKGTLLKY